MIGVGDSGWETGSGHLSHSVVIACPWNKEIQLERRTPAVDLVIQMIESGTVYSLDDVIKEVHHAGYETQVRELRNKECFCSDITKEAAAKPFELRSREEN